MCMVLGAEGACGQILAMWWFDKGVNLNKLTRVSGFEQTHPCQLQILKLPAPLKLTWQGLEEDEPLLETRPDDRDDEVCPEGTTERDIFIDNLLVLVRHID